MSTPTGAKSLDKKTFSQADETRAFDKGKLEVVNIGDTQVGLGQLEPGWKWSTCVKPIAQTESCQSEHLGYFISGRMKVVTDDGVEAEYGPGDVMYIAPGHDAWVVGNEQCVVLDFLGARNYATR
jgi:mannose-6-phosphate isomerase-like protein (cupin superfamily)